MRSELDTKYEMWFLTLLVHLQRPETGLNRHGERRLEPPR